MSLLCLALLQLLLQREREREKERHYVEPGCEKIYGYLVFFFKLSFGLTDRVQAMCSVQLVSKVFKRL
jgi:hypothetical protein